MMRSQRKRVGANGASGISRLLAAQELGDQTAGARRADQADMAMAEGIDDVARGAANSRCREVRPACSADGPNQVLMRDGGISFGSFGNMLKRLLRRISARLQFGAASRPAISTVPAARRPLSVQFTTILASEAMIELRGPEFRVLDHDVIAALGLERQADRRRMR